MKLITKEIEEKFKKFPIGSQDGKGANAKIIAKFFNPTGIGTWYITEGSKLENGDYKMFGYCHLGDDQLAEFGSVYLSELQNIQLAYGMSIERDLYIPKDIDLMQALKRDGIIPHKYLIDNYNDKNSMKLEKGTISSYEEGLQYRVAEKITNEYNDYIENLKNEKPEVIIEKAYEKVCKEEIIYLFEEKDLSVQECKALLKCPNILDECYDNWLNCDSNFKEILEYSVDISIDHILEDFKENLKDKNKNAR